MKVKVTVLSSNTKYSKTCTKIRSALKMGFYSGIVTLPSGNKEKNQKTALQMFVTGTTSRDCSGPNTFQLLDLAGYLSHTTTSILGITKMSVSSEK